MSAHSKRSRSSYLSVPVIVVVLFLLVAKLVAMQRAEIIAELSDRVEHHDPEDASVALRQLGEMPRPPIVVLIAAASGADRQVAREAQQAITRLLRRAQQQLEAGRGAKSVSRQLTELARELADHCHAFPAADQEWLVSTAQRIVRLANDVPQKHAPVVATNCDLILTSIPTTAATANMPAGPQDSATQNPPSVATAIATETAPVNRPGEAGEPVIEESDERYNAPWRADRPQPVFRPLPSQTNSQPAPPTVAPTPSSNSTPPELPADVELIGRPLANIETRTLLQKRHDTGGKGMTAQERELLKQRGFDPLPPQFLQRLFSSTKDRLQLVDEVVQHPGIHAGPWLILLAGDPDPEVRLAAVTLMATSTDSALVEQAWQAAIHDRDPRVAALASRLRERRAAGQR